MTPENTILTDCDGVLLHWSQGFDKFMTELGYPKQPGTDHHYRLSLQYPPLTDDQTRDLVNQFNVSEGVSRLEPWADAVKYVRELHAKGYKFVCITAISSDPQARVHRAKNLDDVFGEGIFNHDEMVCVPVGHSKEEALRKWAGKNYWWVEDHFKHAETGYELGLRSILMDNPHNKHFKTDLFPRVNTWEEIYHMVTAV